MPSPRPIYIVASTNGADYEIFHSLGDVKAYLEEQHEVHANAGVDPELDVNYEVFEVKRQLKIGVIQEKARVVLS